MRKRYLGYANFILFLCLANADVEAQKSGHAGNSKIHIGKAKRKIFSGKSAEKVRDIEVNSVAFIKLPQKANEIFIPDPSIIDVQLLSDNSLYLMGLSPGLTSLVINNKKGEVMINCKVRVTYPLKTMKDVIFELHPDSDVDILSFDNSVILKGRVPSPEAAAEIQDVVAKFVTSGKVVNKLNIETATQVMLKVKIAEVSRDLTKNLGINWRAVSAANKLNGTSLGFVTGSSQSFIPNQLDASAVKEELLKEGGILGAPSGGRWMMHYSGKRGLSGLIDALANESFATILAEPTIIALSGKKAVFKSGGEQGYVVAQPGGSNNNTIEFKEWGTSIEFVPVVLSEDRINITVTPKISTLAFTAGAGGPPSLTTKEASTTVELGSGQSMAIAGLLQKTKDYTTMKTPFWSEIPLFGSLFGSNGVATHEKEIVIIVTPYIVKPASRQLKTPLDMVPKMYSPVQSLLYKRFNISASQSKRVAAGFSIM